MSLEKSLKKASTFFNRYAKGLILTLGKKSCVRIGSNLKISHDKIYRSLALLTINIDLIQNINQELIKDHSNEKPGWLIVDDTAITKDYSKVIQGTLWAYNCLMKKEQKQFTILVIAWTNGLITIPLDFKFYYSKSSTGDLHKTKSELAKELIMKWRFTVPSQGLLGDGYFSTHYLLKFCLKLKIPFVAKFASNRKITTSDGISMQIKNHPKLKLMRNQRAITTQIEWHGMILFCTAHKRKNRNNVSKLVYYISTVKKAAKAYIDLYRLRWNIEIMFRSMKQSLGLKDCSARKKSQHQGHIFGVFYAYAFVQQFKNEKKYKNIEGVIKHLQEAKSLSIEGHLIDSYVTLEGLRNS